jgi:hypothetical protein
MINIDNPKILSIAAAAAFINQKNSPVIFWDTCSLMDIVRIPFPSRKNHPDTDLRIIEIKDAILRGDIISLSSTLTKTEFNNNMPGEIDTFQKSLIKMNIEVNKYLGFINKSNPGVLLPTIDLPSYRLELFYCDIARAIIGNTTFISDEQSFKDSAHTRVIDKITPAKLKPEYKDCYIWETCLQTKLAIVDKTKDWFFTSANHTDYADPIDSTIFANDLIAESNANNIKYAKDFHLLRKRMADIGL